MISEMNYAPCVTKRLSDLKHSPVQTDNDLSGLKTFFFGNKRIYCLIN